MKKIKMYFDTNEELVDCVEKWKERLGLKGWIIAAALCSREDMELENCAGESEVQWVHKCGTVSILRKEDMPEDMLIKQPHEATLIHELLHFKFFALSENTREDSYYEMKQHQLLEEIAKALFLSEYNLDYDWYIEERNRI